MRMCLDCQASAVRQLKLSALESIRWAFSLAAESSDDKPHAFENPSLAGAESTLTENVASPFDAEPRQSLEAKLG